MIILTSNIINGEVRGIMPVHLSYGQLALVVRNGGFYRPRIEEKKEVIASGFLGLPIEESLQNPNLPLIEINHPSVSRLQGVLYVPPKKYGEAGILYLNMGQYVAPQYSRGNRPLEPKDEATLNEALKEGKRIRLSGEGDSLSFVLDKSQRYNLLTDNN